MSVLRRKKDGKRDVVSRAVQAFQVLSDPEFTKHEIFMNERYLILFVVKSTSMMMNDRSDAMGKSLKLLPAQGLRIQSTIQTFLPEQEYNVTQKYSLKKIHSRCPLCLS